MKEGNLLTKTLTPHMGTFIIVKELSGWELVRKLIEYF